MKRSTILGVGLLALAVALPLAAHSTTIYETTLLGTNESPANGSLGTGAARVTVDLSLLTMRVEANFSGLGGNTTASHIHCCLVPAGPLNVGVATAVPSFPGFPLGVTAGSYDQTFDLSSAASYNAAFITANGGTVDTALAALVAGLDGGATYFNIHSTAFPGGEIRGNLHPVPEPELLGLLAIGLVLGAAKKVTAA